MSYSWGCAYKQMDLSSCTRLSLPCQAPEYSTTALHPSWRRSPDTRKVKDWCHTFCLKSGCFAQPTKSLVQFWLANNQLKNWKVKEENWATKVAFQTPAVCVQQDGFSHTNPGHCAGIIQVTHWFLISCFRTNQSYLLKQQHFLSWLAGTHCQSMAKLSNQTCTFFLF